MSRFRWPRVGLRREVVIFLPVATVLILLLGAFTLWSYRSAIHRLVEERRSEAVALARGVVERLRTGPLSDEALRELAPGARFVAVVEADGSRLTATGSSDGQDPLTPLGGAELVEAVALGPDAILTDRVAAFVPVELGSGTRLVRVDLPASELARQLSNLQILLWLNLPLSLALVILLLVFLRYFLTPYETLLAKARLAGESPEDQDEVTFLMTTVETALAKLTQVEEPNPADDIAALERTLGPSLQSGLLLIDLEGRVLALNEIGSELLGLEKPDGAVDVRDLLSPYPPLVEVFHSVVAGVRPAQRLEVEIDTPTGPRTLGLTAHPLKRDDRIVRGHLVLFVDLTQIRRRTDQEKLARSLSQLGELAAGMAHELRNSLATLRGYLTLIQRRPDEDTITDYLHEIRRESEHLERVLEDFLSFARPGSKRLRRVELLALLIRSAEDPTLEGMPVEVQPTALGEIVIKGDEQLLERAVRNLLHNAARAEREAGNEGPLSMIVDRTDEGVEIVITDRGVGVTPDMRDRLFQPFATSRAEGVGLGLALAHRIVSLHGGHLSLEARDGGGTRAVLFFPIDD